MGIREIDLPDLSQAGAARIRSDVAT